MTPEPNDFETFSHNPFKANEILSSEFDPNFNVYQYTFFLDTLLFIERSQTFYRQS